MIEVSVRFDCKGDKIVTEFVDGLFVLCILFIGSFLSLEADLTFITIEGGVDDCDVSSEFRSSWEGEGDVGPVPLSVGIDKVVRFFSTFDVVGATNSDDVVLDVFVTISVEEFVDDVALHDVLEKRSLDSHLLFLQLSIVLVGEEAIAHASDDRNHFVSESIRDETAPNCKSVFVDRGLEGAEAGCGAVLGPVAVV